MTTTLRTAADGLLREALATIRRIADLAATETTSATDARRADAIYDLADAAERVLVTYLQAAPLGEQPRTAARTEVNPNDRAG